MKSLSSVLELQFYIGFFGTLALMPVLYGVQAIWGVFDDSGTPVWVDLIMVFVAPLLCGISSSLTGLAAYPVLQLLQRRGIVKDLL